MLDLGSRHSEPNSIPVCTADSSSLSESHNKISCIKTLKLYTIGLVVLHIEKYHV